MKASEYRELLTAVSAGRATCASCLPEEYPAEAARLRRAIRDLATAGSPSQPLGQKAAAVIAAAEETLARRENGATAAQVAAWAAWCLQNADYDLLGEDIDDATCPGWLTDGPPKVLSALPGSVVVEKGGVRFEVSVLRMA